MRAVSAARRPAPSGNDDRAIPATTARASDACLAGALVRAANGPATRHAGCEPRSQIISARQSEAWHRSRGCSLPHADRISPAHHNVTPSCPPTGARQFAGVFGNDTDRRPGVGSARGPSAAMMSMPRGKRRPGRSILEGADPCLTSDGSHRPRRSKARHGFQGSSNAEGGVTAYSKHLPL